MELESGVARFEQRSYLSRINRDARDVAANLPSSLGQGFTCNLLNLCREFPALTGLKKQCRLPGPNMLTDPMVGHQTAGSLLRTFLISRAAPGRDC
jgi:hypothetical protein